MGDPRLRALQQRIEELEAIVSRLRPRSTPVWRQRLGRALSSLWARRLLVTALLAIPLATWAATLTVPYVFTNGTIADANEVNANFTTLADAMTLHTGQSAPHHEKTTDASELLGGTLDSARLDVAVSLLGTGISASELEFDPALQGELDFHEALVDVHHARYGDSEAQAAVGPHVTSVDGLSGGQIAGSVWAAGMLTSSSGGVRFPDNSIQQSAVAFPNRILVAPSGGDFTSIQAAIDSVSPTATNPYRIDIAAGTYTEDLVLKSYLHLQGAGSEATVITPAATGTQLILVNSLSQVKLSDLMLVDAVGVPPDKNEAISAVGSSLGLERVLIKGFFEHAILASGGSSLDLRDSQIDGAGTSSKPSVSLVSSSASITGNQFTGGVDCVVEAFATSVGDTLNVRGNSFADAVNAVCVLDGYDVDVSHNRLPGLGLSIFMDSTGSAQIIGNSIGGDVVLGRSSSTGGEAEIAIAANMLETGSIRVERKSFIRIVANRLVTGCVRIWPGSQAEIVGNYVGGGCTGMSGTSIFIESDATIVGNTVAGQIDDQSPSGAVIVGNSMLDPQAFSLLSASSTAFANRTPTSGVDTQRFVSDDGIRVESTADGISFVAGGSTVTLAPTGEVTIDAAANILIQAATDLDLRGNNVSITATGTVDITAASIVDVNGSLINLN